MNISEIKVAIKNGRFDKDFTMLYGECITARQRYLSACEKFEKLYESSGDIRIFSAPGRTEIGGNHTDHQHGSVLAGSVNLDVIAIVSLNSEGVIRIKSEGYPMDEVAVGEFSKNDKETGRAISLIRGVCNRFEALGCKIEGFNAYTTSNVMKGSGLSSSAAFEVLVGNIINRIFGGNQSAIEIAKIGQFAEREFFGKPCGLLDQMASSLGGFTYADFNDPSNPVTETVDLDINDFGYTLCVVDTGGNHANLTGDYAAITVECKSVSNALGVEFLRDADIEKFYGSIASLRKTCGDRAVLRAFHFLNEHQRVLDQRDALKNKNFEAFLEMVNASGQSSFDYLQNLYSTSALSEQGLSLGIALTKRFLNGKGACRVHGGGFAGTIQCYIPSDMMSDYKNMIEKVFGEGSCAVLLVRPVGGYELIACD